MGKRDVILLVSEEIESWATDNGIDMTQQDEFELGERIYNLLPQLAKAYCQKEET